VNPKYDSKSAATTADCHLGQPSAQPFRADARAPVRTWDTALLKKEMLRQLGSNADAYPHELERHFPHALARIAALWGSPEMDAYFASLLFSDRPCRQGFPPAVAVEISRLSAIHEALGVSKDPMAGGWNTFTDGDAERWAKQGS
jgi:hypothetical protein